MNDNLSTRLKAAIEKLGVSQSELAKKIGVKPQTIQYLCTSNAEWSKFTFEIAHALDLNPEWLATGKGAMLAQIAKPMHDQIAIPILEKHNVFPFLEGKKMLSKKYISGEFKNKNCFGIEVGDKSLWPQLDEKTIVILDPAKEPKNNELVLVHLNEVNTFVVRKLVIAGKTKRLLPLNLSMYTEIKMSVLDKYIGSVIESRLSYE